MPARVCAALVIVFVALGWSGSRRICPVRFLSTKHNSQYSINSQYTNSNIAPGLPAPRVHGAMGMQMRTSGALDDTRYTACEL